ncbi:MAG: RecQ family ATP-dependent DNA helicase [Acidobacteriaceae bacterium]|nr:RecQ family ATP-dependent DNA helicase [Acidobacteriaceae bacterium]
MASGHPIDSLELLAVLKRYWGYESFRPLQERIVRSVLEGHDVVAVMPTGGGKSLCYQLPAVFSGRTAIVVSPLISLMQDQVAQLKQMGIPAAFVNSALPTQEQSAVLERARRGEFRLIYISPERLARSETVLWLQRVPLAFFAIDEAHCISEWGHEFRPEYRLLSSLRENFPERPIAAFTASATRRVRHDTVAQLQLRDPDKYIKSFHRPNLRYVVAQCENDRTQLRHLLAALKAHAGESVIVYAPTIARVEETADYLRERGIPATPYHGQMSTETRQRNQELWTSDAVRVLVGTLAFGLGIDKPGVRAVIHLALPKSVEQYYQEAGRAGRDGAPSDCVLLWQKKDTALLAYFIEKMQDATEQQRSWQRYREIKRFAATTICRHSQICVHFGETPKWQSCEACDVCAGMPEWLQTGSVDAPKPVKAARTAATPGEQLDPELLEYMREWRREISHRENVPAFMVLSDASLEDLCRNGPRDLPGLRQVMGIGEKKAQSYGAPILDALHRFRQGARATRREQGKESPTEETIRLLRQGRTFDEIAALRERRLGTVIETVANAVEKGLIAFDERWIPADRLAKIEEAGTRVGFARVKQIKDALPPDFTYDEIRLAVSYLKRSRGISVTD